MGDEEIGAAAAPLLAARSYHEAGCPGCAQDRRKERSGGRIPYKELFFVGLTTLASSLPITCLFPFMYFMIRDFHIAKTEEDIGSYAGFLASSYMIGRAFSAIFWGTVADRIGRKPVIVFSIFSVIIFNTLFGLSTEYWMAIATRLVLGSLNGLLPPIKAYAVEVCRPEHQALGLSVISTTWGLGLVIGPALGGYLAQPAEKYPQTFSKESVFGRFPYLLPCLGVSLFAAIVLIISCIWMPKLFQPFLPHSSILKIPSIYAFNRFLWAYILETMHKHKNPEKDIRTVKGLQSESDSPPNKSLLQNWPWMSTMVSYCFFALHDTAYSEILSLWAVSDRKYGGLSFSTEDIGAVLAVAGAGLLVYQLIIYHWVNKFLGPVISSRVASALSILIVSTYPFMTYLSGAKLSFALYSAAMMKSIAAITASTGICLLQNNAVRQEQRGTANGIATTAMSFFKAIAPIGAGIIFSWAQKHQDSTFFPGDQVVFLVLNLVQLLGLIFLFEPFLVLPAVGEEYR